MHGLALRMLAFCLAAIALAVPASAQTVPKVELSGGYQFLNFSLSGANEAMPAGWYFDVAGNLTSMLGVVFKVGGNYKSFEESATIGGITATLAGHVERFRETARARLARFRAHALSSREEVALVILLQLFDRFVSYATRRPLPGLLTPARLPAPEVRRRD